jgi:hypothetical protein
MPSTTLRMSCSARLLPSSAVSESIVCLNQSSLNKSIVSD